MRNRNTDDDIIKGISKCLAATEAFHQTTPFYYETFHSNEFNEEFQ